MSLQALALALAAPHGHGTTVARIRPSGITPEFPGPSQGPSRVIPDGRDMRHQEGFPTAPDPSATGR